MTGRFGQIETATIETHAHAYIFLHFHLLERVLVHQAYILELERDLTRPRKRAVEKILRLNAKAVLQVEHDPRILTKYAESVRILAPRYRATCHRVCIATTRETVFQLGLLLLQAGPYQ